MNILLGISGGIAAYKTPELVRQLRRRGHDVRCLLTTNGARLVTVDTLATLSGHGVTTSMWQEDGSIAHIDRGRWAQALLVAPATANIIAKCALGLADDLLSTTVLALPPQTPWFLAPAMNTIMWHKPVVQGHIASLRSAGCQILGPVDGSLACGDEGLGAMLDPAAIAETVDQALGVL